MRGEKMDELVFICQTLVENLRESLRMPETSFNIWFGDLSLKSLSESEAVFLTPNDLRKNILSTKYKESISDALSSIIGFNVSIRFETLSKDGKEEAPPKKEDEDASFKNDSKNDFLRDRHCYLLPGQ